MLQEDGTIGAPCPKNPKPRSTLSKGQHTHYTVTVHLPDLEGPNQTEQYQPLYQRSNFAGLQL
jgi:hypothetical protein